MIKRIASFAIAAAACLLAGWSCSSTSGNNPGPSSGGTGATSGSGGSGNAGTGGFNTGGTGGVTSPCAPGLASCNGVCTDTMTDFANCGACGMACGAGQTCTGGTCTCAAGLTNCGGACVDTGSDGNNCGTCANVCGAGTACSMGVCGTCAATETQCGNSCVDVNTNRNHCGACDNMCGASESCAGGSCGCPVAGNISCDGTCVNPMTSAQHCGACGNACPTGQSCTGGVCGCGPNQTDCSGTCANTMTDRNHCGACGMACPEGQNCVGGACVEGGNCELRPGMISNFEDGSLDVLAANGFSGTWEAFNGGGGTHEIGVEQWGSEDCNQYALHTTGSGNMSYVGIGFSLAGTPEAPTVYDASAFTGVRFRAKLGGNTPSPVRFNISTPWTEGSENPGGQCSGDGCYNHVGRFLHQENELTTDWQTYTLCFDRDLYPQFLPSNLTTAQRRQVASNVLKMQFVFNAAKNLSQNATPVPEYAKTEPFDLWVDDIELVTESCDDRPLPFESASGTAKAYPQKGADGTVGSCTRPTDADKFVGAIAQAYLRWKENFVRAGNPGQRVLSPEQGDDTPSEAMGYGMLIAAAMGDKAAFDEFWTYVNSQLSNGLMKWSRNGSGSATDADVDIAYALALGAMQWGGDYATRATAMINAIASRDMQSGNRIGPGDSWGSTGAFNASYFTPSFYPVFQALSGSATWSTVRTTNYGILNDCTQWFSGGTLPADWCDVNSSQAVPGETFGAAVTSFPGVAVYAFDAARVPWRIALDACLHDNATAKSYLNTLVGFFNGFYDNGESIDLMRAGFTSSLMPHANAQENQMSFIGPVGVGAMATSHTALRERAFRAVLDIMENPEFNRTYYPATVGMITLLQMSGNFPHRTN